MKLDMRSALLALAMAPMSALGGIAPPGPAADELFTSTFEGVGTMRGFVENTGIVVPGDGLPVVLQEDFDTLFLGKCTRLDCAGGITRTSIAPVDNAKRRATLRLGDDGLPILAYWDSGLSAARFDRCTELTCATRTTETLVAGDARGFDIALDAAGNPVVVFQLSGGSGTGGDIVAVQCLDPACAGLSSPMTLGESQSETKISLVTAGALQIVVAYVESVFSPTFTQTLTVASCDLDDCASTLVQNPVELDPLFTIGTADRSVSMVLPPGGNPVLALNAAPAGGGGNRIVAVTCSDLACSANAEPELLGDGTSYFDDLDFALSADGLPMSIVDEAASGTDMEFVQCQTQDCGGAKTIRGFPSGKVGTGGLPVITVAADGNPLIGFNRGFDRGFGIVHCRDPECQSFRAY